MVSAVGLAAIVSLSQWLLPPLLAAISIALGLAMLAVAIIDVRHFIIPDAISLPAIPAGLLASGSLVDATQPYAVATDHLIGMVLGWLSLWGVRWGYQRWRGVEGLGLGDVKLAAAAGAWVGWQGLPNVLLIAALAGLVAAMIMALWRGEALAGQARIPFGAFLAPALWLVWLAQRAGFLVVA